MRFRQFSFLFSMLMGLFACVQPVMAQRGKLVVVVNPREAYIYADGKPVVEANNHFVTLEAECTKSICTITAINPSPKMSRSRHIRRR